MIRDYIKFKGESNSAEEHALRELIREFSFEMEAKLLQKLKEGRHGWDDPDCRYGIHKELFRAATEGRWLDVGNYAAMMWNLDSGGSRAANEARKDAPYVE